VIRACIPLNKSNFEFEDAVDDWLLGRVNQFGPVMM
jgi:hypothetical protein